MTDMTIRQATVEDAEGIFEIENLCFPDPWSLESIIYEMEQNPAAFYLVAEIDAADAVGGAASRAATTDADTTTADATTADATEEAAAADNDKLIVGYAGLWWIEDEGHITNVAVRPGYRNRRIGSQILETLLEFTRQEGIGSYTLEVRESNEAARALYEKYGFRVEGFRKNYYRHVKEDALILWRRTGSAESEQGI